MGKRSSFERVPRDFYPTPREALLPLIPHLRPLIFCEPCAGDGRLIQHLEAMLPGLWCGYACDIKPQADELHGGDCITRIERNDARTIKVPSCDMFITNPPWSRDVLHPIIMNLSRQAPTWLLFDADWMHTRQSTELMRYCRKIVSVGRVKWIPDSPFTGKDNCCWYLFDPAQDHATHFVARAA